MTRFHAIRSAGASERGAALVMALLVLVVLTAFGLTLVGLGMTEVAISTNWRDYTKDFYAAEAGVESGIVGLRNLLSGVADPSTVSQATLNTIAAPSLNTPGTTYSTYTVTPVAPVFQSTFASGPYAGLFGQVYAYNIRAQVTGQGGTRADVTQVYNYTQVPLFQFGVFYGKGVDLEIAPGPPMTFNGRVHANSNIYIGTQAGSSCPSCLKIDSYMTTAGSIYRRIKRDSNYPWYNDPQILGADGSYHALDFDADFKADHSTAWADTAEYAAALNATFGGKVQDSSMGVAEIVPPVPGLFYNPSNPDVVAHQLIEMPNVGDSAQLAAAKMYSQATVRIIDGVASYRSSGGSWLSGLPCGSPPAGSVTARSFYDAREGKTVNATQLDVGSLRSSGCLNSSSLYGGAVVLYTASTTAPTGSNVPAVRLVNGAQLPSGGT
ncbi:MAG TPA: PilX N-terminal domain-containing pilus assembly protein, partial [Candidatus Polarisedimenticolia bacterium]|nr:PilX N-terminal domain-containing pilus assembly protein [Candidatus Polarisedimenticolia bacterium]